MKFHLNYKHPEQPCKISHKDKILLIGSCFSEHIGEKLSEAKFNCHINPNGILFNPSSISQAIRTYLQPDLFSEKLIIQSDNLFHSYQHHGSFSDSDKNTLLNKISEELNTANKVLKSAGYLILTFGTAHVFKLNETNNIVANCHKLPQQNFTRHCLQPAEIINDYHLLITAIRKINPSIKIIFTVSPVKYLREGLIENNRSKSILNYSVHEIIRQNTDCFYFPAYEIVTDDLRDYRFFKSDLSHPNELAIEYVWGQFSSGFFTEETINLCKELAEITKAASHRPIHPETTQHATFKNNYLKKCQSILEKYPELSLKQEIKSFT